MIRRTRRLRLLCSHWAVLAEALVTVAVVRIGLTTVGQDRARGRVMPGPSTSGIEMCDPKPIAWAVRQTARLVPRASCLTQAIAGQAMLARRGLAANLRIGVRRGPTGAFEAHAWLIHRDAILLGATHEPGEPFVTIAEIGLSPS